MELALLKWIQSFSSPFWDGMFQLITMLGEQWAVILVLAVSYWAFDKKTGEELAFTLLVSGLSNNILKGFFRFERPIGIDGIRTLRAHTATGPPRRRMALGCRCGGQPVSGAVPAVFGRALPQRCSGRAGTGNRRSFCLSHFVEPV